MEDSYRHTFVTTLRNTEYFIKKEYEMLMACKKHPFICIP